MRTTISIVENRGSTNTRAIQTICTLIAEGGAPYGEVPHPNKTSKERVGCCPSEAKFSTELQQSDNKNINNKKTLFRMDLVDVHCHLTHEKFKKDLDLVVERARKAGVKAIVCSGVNHPTNVEVLELAKKYDLIKASLGLYPIDLLGLGPDEVGLARQTEKIDLSEELKFIKKHKQDIVAVGECGLDYHWDKEHHTQQKKNFEQIISFVEKLKKPLVVHSRRAELDAFEMLESSSIKKSLVVLHCFEGRKHLLKKAADAGYNFTIPCNVVRLQHFQTLIGIASLNQIFTETDAPWLSAFPGKRNEPAFVAESIKKIAELKKISPDKVARAIWKNYGQVFK
ncbi:TatD family hydrolase [Candidatus Woesearchaeota archaeon]|nr:TatD family hydrolase [Candidatus Woesearchaeota archaeon]